jgi:hypothetical protein
MILWQSAGDQNPRRQPGQVWHRAIALLKLLRRKPQLDAVAVTAVIQACGNVEKWRGSSRDGTDVLQYT